MRLWRGDEVVPKLTIRLRRVAVPSGTSPRDFAELVAGLRNAVQEQFASPSLATRVDVVDDSVFGGNAVGTFGVEARWWPFRSAEPGWWPFHIGRVRMAESFHARLHSLWEDPAASHVSSLSRKDAINLLIHEYIHSVSSTHWDGTINEGLTELATVVFLDEIIRGLHLNDLDPGLLHAVMPRGYVGAHVMAAAHLIVALADVENRSPREVLRDTITLGGNLRALDLQIDAAVATAGAGDPRPEIHRLLAGLHDSATAAEGRECGIAMAAELRRVALPSRVSDPSPAAALDRFGVTGLEGMYGLN